MSLATLKKKTQTKYNNMSVGGDTKNNKGFSLVGSHRNQGYVGQGSLGRSLPRTIMKDNIIHGSGGCCGTYNVTTIVQSGVKCENDSSVVKKLGFNTKGMLANRRMKYLDEDGNLVSQVVKPDSNQNNNTGWDHIKKVKNETIIEADSSLFNVEYTQTCCDGVISNPVRYKLCDDEFGNKNCPTMDSSLKKFFVRRKRNNFHFTKDTIRNKGESYSTYLERSAKFANCPTSKNNKYSFLRTTLPTNIGICG